MDDPAVTFGIVFSNFMSKGVYTFRGGTDLLIKAMKAELEWVRQNPKGRQAKSKARLSRFEELSQHEHQARNETQEIFIPVAERLGNEVIEFDKVSKGYGERLLINPLPVKPDQLQATGLQFAGPSVFIFWIVAFLTFLITGAFVTAQLGRMFPEEGSLYVWTHKALGPFWGFFAGFVAWWPGIFGMVFAAALVTFFVLNDESRALVREGRSSLAFLDPDDPAHGRMASDLIRSSRRSMRW